MSTPYRRRPGKSVASSSRGDEPDTEYAVKKFRQGVPGFNPFPGSPARRE